MRTPGLKEIVEAGAPPHQVGPGRPFAATPPDGGDVELRRRVELWLTAATGDRPAQRSFVLGAIAARGLGRSPEAGTNDPDGHARLADMLADAVLVDRDDPPDWVQALDDFLQALPADQEALLAMGSPGSDEAQEWRPDPQVDPLTLVWNGALAAGLALLPEVPSEALKLTDLARTDLAVSLVGRVLAAVTRSLDPELQAARSLGLHGADAVPGDRTAWIERLHDYPGLAYPLGTAIDHWRRTTQQMLQRLLADIGSIASQVLDGPPPHTVLRCAGDAGDPHEGGKSVSIIRFDGDRRVVYKPKPQQGPAAWQQLLAVIGKSTAVERAGVELATRRLLVLDDYGWDSWVPSDPSMPSSHDASVRWLRSYGALCRVLELLESADMWFDNLLTHAGLPQFIDVETLLQPKPHRINDAQRILADSIVPTGAVSMPLPLPTGEVEDIGGLRPVGTVRLPFTAAVMGQLSSRAEGYDDQGIMRWTPPRWRPDLSDEVDVVAEMMCGYSAVCEALRDGGVRRNVEDAITTLAASPSRVVLRSTFVCYVLLRESLRPEVLTSGWQREVALSALLAPAAAAAERAVDTPPGSSWSLQDQLLNVGLADLATIRDLDIPLVRHDPRSEAVCLDGNAWLDAWFGGSPLGRALQRVQEQPFPRFRATALEVVTRAALATGTTGAREARAEARQALIQALVDEGISAQDATDAIDAVRA